MDDARHDPPLAGAALEDDRARDGSRSPRRDRSDRARREPGQDATSRRARQDARRETRAEAAGAEAAPAERVVEARAAEPKAKSKPPSAREGRASEARGAEAKARDAEPRAEEPVAPPATRARRRGRHTVLIAAFFLVALLPWGLTTAYLYLRAADQYASTTGFAVRTEDMGSAFDILGGIPALGGSSSSSDTDILYEFIQGQQLIGEIDEKLDLKAIYSRHWATDPVFSLRPDATIEDLVNHWGHKVQIAYDAGTGLIEIHARAFDPLEAQAIATAILERSAEMINDLSAIARDDATRYAREELEEAVERLKLAREAMSAFRSRTQIVDPAADLQGQMGLINTLQGQLAAALIELDLLRETAREGDPRIEQAQRRIDVIERRIGEERGKFSIGGAEAEGEDYVAILAEFDRLDVDLQFARTAYTAALSAFDTAQAEAQRKSRYLAAYVTPTLPQSAEYPRRAVLSGLAGLFLLLSWAILSLVFYSIRDRR